MAPCNRVRRWCCRLKVDHFRALLATKDSPHSRFHVCLCVKQTDSGAPLTCDDPGRPGRTVLVGLLSWNAACRGVLGWPDVYTRMADVDTFCWLERTVTSMLERTTPFFGDPLCV